MSGFVLTNRSANIFGNIPFLRGQVYNICVTCEDLDLQTLNLGQYLHAILPLLLNNSCTYKVSQSANLQAEAKSMLRYLEINLAILRPPRGDRKKSRGGKYMEGIPKFEWHQLYKTKCLSHSNLWFVDDIFRMRWLENCKTSGLIWTRWWFVGEVGFRYGSLRSRLLGKEPMFS